MAPHGQFARAAFAIALCFVPLMLAAPALAAQDVSPDTVQNTVEPIEAPTDRPIIIRISDEVEERKPALQAMLTARPGWVVGEEAAQYEIVPNPEFPDDLWLVPIKGMTADTREAYPSYAGQDGSMTTEEIIAYFSDPVNQQRAWATNVPKWIDIGAMEVEGFEQRLDAALDPILRRRALTALESIPDNRTSSTCLSDAQVPDGYCPMPLGRGWNEVEVKRPVYISVQSTSGSEGRFITVVAVAPDESVQPIFSLPVQRSPGTLPEQQIRYANNNDSPVVFETPGRYDIITITSDAPINPEIWTLPLGGFAGPETCRYPLEVDLCRAMLASAGPSLFGAQTSYSVQSVMVYSTARVSVPMVGGTDADALDAPFQAQLFFASTAMPAGSNAVGAAPLVRRQDFERSHHCGGSYIRGGYVLTSAHCIPTKASELKKLYVRLGTINISTGGTAFRIESIARHTRGRAGRNRSDIALIKLKPSSRLKRLEGTTRLDPIPIAAGNQANLRVRENVRVFGWGFTGAALPNAGWEDFQGNRQSSSRTLQKLDLAIAARSQCDRTQYRRYDPDKRLCVVSPVGGRGICYKDSGGPLIKTDGGRRYLVGVVTAGIGCALGQNPMLFMNATKFAGWVSRAKAALNVPGAFVRPVP